MGKRSLFYWGKEYTHILKAGQDYMALPNVIAINIVNYNFPPLGEFHTCFHLREDSHREYVLTDALEIHFVNMVQYRKRARSRQLNGRLDDPLIRWLDGPLNLSVAGAFIGPPAMPHLFNHTLTGSRAYLGGFDASSPPELREEAIKMDEAIQIAEERLAQVTEDDEAMRAYWRRTMALCDYTSSMNWARDEGRAEELQWVLELVNQGLSTEEIKETIQKRL